MIIHRLVVSGDTALSERRGTPRSTGHRSRRSEAVLAQRGSQRCAAPAFSDARLVSAQDKPRTTKGAPPSEKAERAGGAVFEAAETAKLGSNSGALRHRFA